MCGCNLSLLKDGFSGNDLFQDTSLRQALSEYKMLSKTEFDKGKVLQLLQYAFCLDPNQFKQVFANVGMSVQGEDIPALAVLIEGGGDKDGTLTNDAGVTIHIDALDMVKKMRFTPEQIQNATCSIYWVK